MLFAPLVLLAAFMVGTMGAVGVSGVVFRGAAGFTEAAWAGLVEATAGLGAAAGGGGCCFLGGLLLLVAFFAFGDCGCCLLASRLFILAF